MEERRNNNVVPSSGAKPKGSSGGGLPDPNAPVKRPPKAAPKSGAAQPKSGESQHRAPVRRPAPQTEAPVQQSEDSNKPKKRKGKGKFIALGVVGAVVIGMFGIRAYNKSKPEPKPEPTLAQVNYDNSGRSALGAYLEALKTYNASAISAVSENSWVAEEWEYANEDELRQNWIKSVCAYVDFAYPQSQGLDTEGNVYLDANGQPVMQDSPMNNGESLTVTYVDFEKLGVTMLEDSEQIIEAYEASGYSPDDYDFQQEMTNLMLDYLLTKANYPTKTTELVISVSNTSTATEGETGTTESATEGTVTDGTYRVVDDSQLDQLLFSSDEFHGMLDSYSSLIIDYEYQKKVAARDAEVSARDAEIKADEDALKARLDAEEITQVEYDLLFADKRFTQEELDLKVEEEDLDISDSVFEELLTPKKVYPEIPELPTKEELYPAECVVPYTWVGSYYCRNIYEGNSNKEPQEGDGTFEKPAGVGTTIITKALCSDGEFHDIKVTLVNYCFGKDAIVYAQKYSEKNRGWDTESITQLICFELLIENLEDTTVTLDSQMFLSDEHGNKSSRTGSIFGFKESITLEPHESGYINTWATSTELPYKYVCWGSEFNREFPVVWFKLLAGGDGELGEFNATQSFVGIQDTSSKEPETSNE